MYMMRAMGKANKNHVVKLRPKFVPWNLYAFRKSVRILNLSHVEFFVTKMVIDQFDQRSLWLLIRQPEWKQRAQLEGLDKDEVSRRANERRYAADCWRVRHRHVEHFGHALHAPLYRLRHIALVVRLRRGAAGHGGWERLRPRRVAHKARAVPGTCSWNVCRSGCLGTGNRRQNIWSAWDMGTST